MPQKKVILNGIDARNKILKGANFLADSVKLTYGPAGKNALIGPYIPVKITNDGHRIAKEMVLPDEIEQLGLATLREATAKTNDEAGDGTTTATIFAQAILKTVTGFLADKGTFANKRSARSIMSQISKECDDVVEKLKAMATPVTTREQLIAVAKVSVENDKLAELIGGTQFDLGPEGTVIAELSNDGMDSVERIFGVRIDNGFGTSRMITNQEKQTLEVENCPIILTNATIHNFDDMVPLLTELAKQTKQIVFVARAYDDNALLQIAKNMQNGFTIFAVNAPYVDQTEVMEDLEAVTGATFFNLEKRQLKDMQLSDVGSISRVSAGRMTGIITGHNDDKTKERVAERIERLEKQIKGEQSAFYKNMLISRVSQLKNGFAIVKVGAASATEREYKKDKADDAVNAVKAALQEGVVPGAGMAFKEIANGLPDDSLLKSALCAPYDQIMANAEEVIEIEAWVQDPVKVCRIALQNACSVAGVLATTGIAINKEYEKPRFVEEAKKSDHE